MNRYEITLWGNDGFHMNLWADADNFAEAATMVEKAAEHKTIEATERIMIRRVFGPFKVENVVFPTKAS